jgi:aerobic-type carbon monoxide dehydrogenase small subunit (CoxS/CutS family)
MLGVIELEVNGVQRRLELDAARSLLSVLRDDLGLTGAKYGCGEGECGACTIHLEGKAVRSCITSIGECAGRRVTTIEGLTPENGLHPLQAAFLEADALQCGYCTPGMIMSAAALLARKSRPTRDEIVQGMNGNICRCGTYRRIIAAVRSAAEGEETTP